MKILDRILKIPPEQVESGGPNYEMCQFGGRAVLTGIVATLGGYMATRFGVEAGGDSILAGVLTLGIGGFVLMAGSMGLDMERGDM